MTVTSELREMFRCQHGHLWETADEAARCNMRDVFVQANNDDVEKGKKDPSHRCRLYFHSYEAAGVMGDDRILHPDRIKIPGAILNIATDGELDTVDHWIRHNLDLLEAAIAAYLQRDTMKPELAKPTPKPTHTEEGHA